MGIVGRRTQGRLVHIQLAKNDSARRFEPLADTACIHCERQARNAQPFVVGTPAKVDVVFDGNRRAV